jgi:hypothetical protein
MFIPTIAYAIDLRFPVACRLMDNCWITNHVDLENRAGQVEDYMCGKKATDGNKSTHISLASRSAINQNIPVIAVADGEVITAANIGGFCGIRVAIEHNKGWESSYCHLKENSLQVQEGQIVRAGQILGAVGMSGQTNWPRLSYALLRNGMIFDPFSGRTVLEGCSDNASPMWTGGANPLYEPANVTSVGFSNRPVGNSDILNGTAKSLNTISNDAPQLSLWGLIMNVREKDQIDLSILTPEGQILNDYKIIAKSSKDYFPIYFPTLQKNILWDDGVYTGRITLTRNVNGKDITTGKIVLITMN